jgi:hypothetical protein
MCFVLQEADPIPDKYDVVVQVKACALSSPNIKVKIYNQSCKKKNKYICNIFPLAGHRKGR